MLLDPHTIVSFWNTIHLIVWSFVHWGRFGTRLRGTCSASDAVAEAPPPNTANQNIKKNIRVYHQRPHPFFVKHGYFFFKFFIINKNCFFQQKVTSFTTITSDLSSQNTRESPREIFTTIGHFENTNYTCEMTWLSWFVWWRSRQFTWKMYWHSLISVKQKKKKTARTFFFFAATDDKPVYFLYGGPERYQEWTKTKND